MSIKKTKKNKKVFDDENSKTKNKHEKQLLSKDKEFPLIFTNIATVVQQTTNKLLSFVIFHSSKRNVYKS